MRKYNRRLRRIAILFWFCGCESLEGERLLVPAAHVSLFLPANWEGTQLNSDAALFEATPRAIKTVKLQVLLEPRAAPTLEDMQKRALLDVQELARKSGLKIEDVTQIAQKRGHIQGMRLVHQMISEKAGTAKLELTEIADLLPIDGKAVVVMVLGPKEQIDAVSAEIDRVLASVRSLTPEPETPRTYPPEAVTGASQRVVQRLLR